MRVEFGSDLLCRSMGSAAGVSTMRFPCRRFGLCHGVAIGLALVLASAAHAEDIVEAHVKALGGSEAIAAVRTVRRMGTVSGDVNGAPFAGTMEEIRLSASEGYQAFELTGYSRMTAWNGDAGWVSDTAAGIVDMSTQQATQARFSGPLSLLAAMQVGGNAGALTVAGEKSVNGVPCTVVKIATAPGWEFCVNTQTKLLEGVSGPDGSLLTFADYAVTNGVQFPGKSTTKLPAQNLSVVVQFTATEVNGEVDAAKLKKPTTPLPPPANAAAPVNVTAEQMMGFMDANRDGKITKDEAPAELKANFALVDTNGDGGIDVKEAQAMADFVNNQNRAGQAQGAQASEGGEALFAEGATQVRVETLLRGFDADRDLSIEEAELNQGFQGMLTRFEGCRGTLMKLFDGDQDGALNPQETQAVREFVFGCAGMLLYDANRDWRVDDEEANRGWEKLAEKAAKQNERGVK